MGTQPDNQVEGLNIRKKKKDIAMEVFHRIQVDILDVLQHFSPLLRSCVQQEENAHGIIHIDLKTRSEMKNDPRWMNWWIVRLFANYFYTSLYKGIMDLVDTHHNKMKIAEKIQLRLFPWNGFWSWFQVSITIMIVNSYSPLNL